MKSVAPKAVVLSLTINLAKYRINKTLSELRLQGLESSELFQTLQSALEEITPFEFADNLL